MFSGSASDIGSIKPGHKKNDSKDDKKNRTAVPQVDLGNLLYNEKLSELGAARQNLDKKVQAAAIQLKKERAKKKIQKAEARKNKRGGSTDAMSEYSVATTVNTDV